MTSTDEYHSCMRCIMSQSDDPFIQFDQNGVCTHCRKFDEGWRFIPKTEEESRAILEPVLARVKQRGAEKPYDCIIGLSGGVDSSYISLLTKRFGLRPLAVHFDNGWNSELAVKNIERIVSKLAIDLRTYVIDWEDFRELQLAYLRASVVDVEALTDHAIYGALYSIAIAEDVTTIISGVNYATESVLPFSWIHDKLDDVNIKDIYRRYGSGRKLNNYPFIDKRVRRKIKNSQIETIRILDLLNYNDSNARRVIQDELGWCDYGGKHHESVFTRFYQCYILPQKFKIDKRKAHLSNLICSGQITREQALIRHQKPDYSAEQSAEDLEFVLKKLKLTHSEFEELMNQPPRRHLDFENYRSFFGRNPLLQGLKPFWLKHRKRLKPLATALGR